MAQVALPGIGKPFDLGHQRDRQSRAKCANPGLALSVDRRAVPRFEDGFIGLVAAFRPYGNGLAAI
jgi:hypothetical protein